MQHADKGTPSTQPDGTGLRIGIVQARFNESITNALAQACRSTLEEDLNIDPAHITLVQVPGALEVPLALMALAERDEFDALIALGCIIRGETYHFELVANESGAGVTRIALDHALPIANAILTVDNIKQAKERQIEKGVDAARVAVEMALLMRAV